MKFGFEITFERTKKKGFGWNIKFLYDLSFNLQFVARINAGIYIGYKAIVEGSVYGGLDGIIFQGVFGTKFNTYPMKKINEVYYYFYFLPFQFRAYIEAGITVFFFITETEVIAEEIYGSKSPLFHYGLYFKYNYLAEIIETRYFFDFNNDLIKEFYK